MASILRLRTYTADVEILGTVHRVCVDGDENVLTIFGCELDRAGLILETLATGNLRAVEQDAVKRNPLATEETPLDADTPVPMMLTPAGVEALAKAHEEAEKVSSEKQDARKPAKVPAKEEPVAVADGRVEEEEKQEAASATDDDGEINIDDQTLSDLKAVRRLRDVLAILETVGAKGPDQLVEGCKAIKEDVPLLSRISNLDERVRRTYEVMASENDA
jgi:hypothetical protein